MTQVNGDNKEVDSLVSDEIKEVLKKVVEENGINNYKINIEAGSIKGDNYLGIIAKVVVDGKDAKGNEVKLNYIVKSAPKSEGFRNTAPIRFAYEREIFVYTVVLPEFMKFQEKRKVKNPFKSYAKCLKTSFEDKNEAIIMEDMKQYGFIMQNRRLPLSYAHVVLILKELAKLHSFSFAMRDQEPELFEKLENKLMKNFMDEIDKEQFDKHADTIYDKARQSLDPVKDAEAIKRYNTYVETINVDILNLLLGNAAGQYGVIRHADCWTNNFLFAYEDKDKPNEPTKLCFLDWQITCMGSPVLDLLYFLHSCTDNKLLSNVDDLLKLYYDNLRSFTAELGSDIEQLFPFSVFMEHMKKFGPYGLAIATMLIHLMTSESEEVPDINEAFEDGNDMMDAFSFESKNKDYYQQRIRDIILHQIEKEYI